MLFLVLTVTATVGQARLPPEANVFPPTQDKVEAGYDIPNCVIGNSSCLFDNLFTTPYGVFSLCQTQMYLEFNDEQEEKFMLAWSSLNMQKMKIGVAKIGQRGLMAGLKPVIGNVSLKRCIWPESLITRRGWSRDD